MLFNDVVAVRHVVTDPDAVIVTLDSDDMLLRHDALRSILSAHQQVSCSRLCVTYICTRRTTKNTVIFAAGLY